VPDRAPQPQRVVPTEEPLGKLSEPRRWTEASIVDADGIGGRVLAALCMEMPCLDFSSLQDSNGAAE